MARKDGKDRGVLEWPKDSDQWWMRAYHDGKEKRYGPFPTKSEAKGAYQRWTVERRKCIALGIPFDPSKFTKAPKPKLDKNLRLGAWIDQYLEGCTAKSVSEQKRYGKWWKKIRVNGRPLGQWDLKDIRTSDLQRIQKLLLEKGQEEALKEKPKKGIKSKATINRYFAFLRHILYLAVREGRLERNPVAGVKFFKEPKGRVRFLTEGEEKVLKEKMAIHDWALVSFALNTGLRQSEQFNLRWEHIDTDNKVLTVPRSKSGESRHVQLNAEVLGILKGLTSWMTSAWVFPSPLDPKKPRSGQAFYLKFYVPAVEEAKLEDVVWHTLRHTFASRLVMKGVHLRVVQELMGHKDFQTTLRYAHLAPGYLHDAVSLLNPVGTVTTTVTCEASSKEQTSEPIENEWLGDEESNLDRQIQSLPSCH